MLNPVFLLTGVFFITGICIIIIKIEDKFSSCDEICDVDYFKSTSFFYVMNFFNLISKQMSLNFT